MPLPDPAGIPTAGSVITGTLATTIQRLLISVPHAMLRFPVTGTGPIYVKRMSVAAADAASLATGGSAAGLVGAPYYLGDSDTLESPQPGILPWVLIWWGTAGDEVVTLEGRP